MAFYLRDKLEIQEEIGNTQVPKAALAIWSLGQAGMVIKNHDGDILAIDPYLTRTIEINKPDTEFVRSFDPVLEPEQLNGADAVLITHYHDDHMDAGTLTRLARVDPTVPIYVPPPDAEKLAETHGELADHIRTASTGQIFRIGHFSILPVAAAHSDYEKDGNGFDRYIGYCIRCDGIGFYHSGDTLMTPMLVEEVARLAPDVLALPINGGDFARLRRGIVPNMSFRDAADFYHAVQGDLLLPIHYDMFTCNSDNPSYFVDYMFNTYPGHKFHLLMPGERFIYMR